MIIYLNVTVPHSNFFHKHHAFLSKLHVLLSCVFSENMLHFLIIKLSYSSNVCRADKDSQSLDGNRNTHT